MTKEEQLKIYTAYLPYALKLQHMYEKAKHEGETVLRSWVKPLEPLDLGCLFPYRKDSFDWKPILYDLSYLTKEIEHEGETFVPTERLMNYASNFGVNRGVFEHMLSSILEGNTLITELPYYLIVKLLEWHLNVFQLPEGEYINKATLTNKK